MNILSSSRPAASKVGFILGAFLLGSLPAVRAQPSGGPYGPIRQTYDLPKAAHIYYVSPDGKADAPGTAPDRPTTLETAIPRVVTGDAIVLRGGAEKLIP